MRSGRPLDRIKFDISSALVLVGRSFGAYIKNGPYKYTFFQYLPFLMKYRNEIIFCSPIDNFMWM